MAEKDKLTGDDKELWDQVLRSVKPLRRRRAKIDIARPGIPAADDTDQPGPAEIGATPGRKARRRAPQKPTAAPYSPPVSSAKAKLQSPPGLEPRERRRLARGQKDVDDRLDLHGLRQATAFHTLAGFLRRAQARRLKTVLVITGKGSSAAAEPEQNEPGVLRRLVPEWLSGPQFRDLVIGHSPASRRHGGKGALYVRIRRKR